MKIGLALSGGGYRATVFHLGVLEWFARKGHLEDVQFLSTVSGGSICVGLIFAAAGNRWPDNDKYRKEVIPQIRGWMTTVNLQRDLALHAFSNPFQIFQTRADDLAELMEKRFNMKGNMQRLLKKPRWIINTTCYETGKSFQIEQRWMGDYRLGYVKEPRLKISEAVAASAGFPVGIGPLEIRPDSYSWLKFEDHKLVKPIDTPAFEKLHLWDGGVYDNLGDEPLTNPNQEIREGFDFLVISDASGLFKDERYRFGVEPLKRLLDIATSQVRAVRSRALVGYMEANPGHGIYLQIDNTVPLIITQATKSGTMTEPVPGNALDHVHGEKAVEAAANMKTHIQDLNEADFELLFRQGFEVANATYYGYISQEDWLNYEV